MVNVQPPWTCGSGESHGLGRRLLAQNHLEAHLSCRQRWYLMFILTCPSIFINLNFGFPAMLLKQTGWLELDPWTSPWRFRRLRICVRQLAWLLFPAKLARFQLVMSHACNLKTANNIDMSKGSKGMVLWNWTKKTIRINVYNLYKLTRWAWETRWQVKG